MLRQKIRKVQGSAQARAADVLEGRLHCHGAGTVKLLADLSVKQAAQTTEVAKSAISVVAAVQSKKCSSH